MKLICLGSGSNKKTEKLGSQIFLGASTINKALFRIALLKQPDDTLIMNDQVYNLYRDQKKIPFLKKWIDGRCESNG